MNVSDAIEWIRLSLRSASDRMPKEIAFALEDAMACIEDVGRLGGPNSPFAYRFLPQVLQYVACMRDSFSAIIRGEDRGAKMLQTHASRITDLHATLVELVDKEKKERDYHRCEKQARLDRMLHRRSMRRATESPYIIGDCMFDSVSYKLRLIGMPMSSIDIRRAAMRQLRSDYEKGVDEIFTSVIPYIRNNG